MWSRISPVCLCLFWFALACLSAWLHLSVPCFSFGFFCLLWLPPLCIVFSPVCPDFLSCVLLCLVRACGQMVSDSRFLSARQVRRQVRGKCGTHCPNSPMSSICSSRTPGCSVSLSPATKSQNIVMSPVLQDVVQGPCHRGLMQRPLPPSASILFCNRLPSQAWCQNWDVG